jgi:lipid-A-disaccharide synthase
VVAHIPRIYKQYKKLLRVAENRRPDLAILTDAPDFHLRLARRLRMPVAYLVAPQAWAWRRGRVRQMRRHIARLLCIFPFEEPFFRQAGLNAAYIGHPLAGLVAPKLAKEAFFRKHRLPPDRPLISVLPGSRRGEAARHLPALLDAAARLYREQAVSFVLPASPTTGGDFFRERIGRSPIQVIEGENWDAIAHSDVALAASGTVTIEAALLGTPMVTYYRVTPVSWLLGKALVKVPFYSMVNLIAQRRIVPELMQDEMTGERLWLEASRLLNDLPARERMCQDLARVARELTIPGEPMKNAAAVIQELMEGHVAHVS